MHRSSESFAALAAALAKAQAELVNPEKSLTATIRSPRAGEKDRSFRYAPLSSGLDIVRKTLGQCEIATVQTTAIDQAAGMVNLTTMLAHSSGEWIASDWPVCPIAEMASPQRMGAALTYARRYALFTMVGIAGEDDLDAPDICVPAPVAGLRVDHAVKSALQLPPRTDGYGRTRATVKSASTMVLSFDESAALRDRLLSEIAAIQSQDSATSWAREALAAKNRLTAADAKLLEDTFEQKLSEFLASKSTEAPAVESSSTSVAGPQQVDLSDSANRQSSGIDKSILAVSVPRRYRNKEHLRFVTQQPCLLCARKPSDAHHLRFVQPRALGRKASDEFAVPLCRTHHRAVHWAGNEAAWWKEAGIDPLKVARKLWRRTRMAEGRVRPSPTIPVTASVRPLESQGTERETLA
jgi:hypothetical protein